MPTRPREGDCGGGLPFGASVGPVLVLSSVVARCCGGSSYLPATISQEVAVTMIGRLVVGGARICGFAGLVARGRSYVWERFCGLCFSG